MGENMAGAWRQYSRYAAFVLAVLFTVGTAGHVYEPALPLMLGMTPGFLLLTNLLVVAPALAAAGWRFGAWLLGAYVLTFMAEAIGVATGSVFGEYTYGATLGVAWHNVPLIIAFNWVMVVHGVVCIAGKLVSLRPEFWKLPAIVMLSGVLAVAFDFAMEPVAIRLDYWQWTGGSIPLQNYGAWFVIAVLSAAFHPWQMQRSSGMGAAGRLAGFFVIVQAVFFIALRLMWHFAGV
jgi:putative membrane protein